MKHNLLTHGDEQSRWSPVEVIPSRGSTEFRKQMTKTITMENLN